MVPNRLWTRHVLKGLIDTPIILLPAILTIVIMPLIPRHLPLRTSSASALTGAATVAIFLLAAEATARTAMGVAIWRSEDQLCIFGKQSFATSLTDLVRSIGFFGDDFRSNHHARAATSGRRILTWSYRTLSFVPTDDKTPLSPHRFQRLYKVLCGPYCLGASRHRKPLRLMKIIPLRTRLSSTRGLPRDFGKKG